MDKNCDGKVIDWVKINLTALEDWFVAYSVMKDPKKRIPLLKEHFNNSKISHRDLLERNLRQELPQSIKADIDNILRI